MSEESEKSEGRYFITSSNDPETRKEISYDDYEYLLWVKDREREALERMEPRKASLKQKLVALLICVLALVSAIYFPIKLLSDNTGGHVNHKTYSTWVAAMSAMTKLVEAEYVFIDATQVNGVYFGSEDLIIVARRSDDATYIHELAHAADKNNYFPFERALKGTLLRAYKSHDLTSTLFTEKTTSHITTELFADAVLYMETSKCGNYFSAAYCYTLTNAVDIFVETNGIKLKQENERIDYTVPDRYIEGSITRSSDIDHLLSS